MSIGIVTDDGRFVAFTSSASDLVDGDTNNSVDAFIFDRQMPVPPNYLLTKSNSATSIDLTWFYEQTNISAFHIERSLDGLNGWLEIATVSPTVRTYSDTTISASTYYYYRVRVRRADTLEFSGYSNVANAVMGGCTVGGVIQRISIAADGSQSLNDSLAIGSSSIDMTPDGLYIVFDSAADNLVPSDSNGHRDVFLRETTRCDIRLVSVSTNGDQGNGDSTYPTISSLGHYIAYQSDATNLVTGDNNGFTDVFIYNSISYQTTLASIQSNSDGTILTQGNAPAIHPDLSSESTWYRTYVGFESVASNWNSNGEMPDANGVTDIFIAPIDATYIYPISTGFMATANGPSSHPHVFSSSFFRPSVIFTSEASNIAEYDTNTLSDIVYYEGSSGMIYLWSIYPNTTQWPGPITDFHSYGGQNLVFESSGTTLVSNDTNGVNDVFYYNGYTFPIQMVRVSVGINGEEANGPSSEPMMSTDGRFVAFLSEASNLVPGDTNGVQDLFLYDRQMGTTRRVSVSATGEQANGPTLKFSMSSDGRYIAFESTASNLVPNDSNGTRDIFFFDRDGDGTTPIPNYTPTPTNTMTPTFTRTPTNTMTPTPTRTSTPTSTNTSTSTPTPSLVALSSPTNLIVTAQNRTSVSFTWVDSNTTESEYRIERSVNSPFHFQEIAVVPTAATYVFTDTSIAPSTNYFYHVRAYRASDDTFSGYSLDSWVQTYTACSPDALVQLVTSNNDGESLYPDRANMSGDGRYVVFSTSSQVPPEDTNSFYDVYVHDRITCNTTLISRTDTGQAANDDSRAGSISDDGRWVVFASEATDLVSNTTVKVYQIYLHDRQTGQTILVSHNPSGIPGDGASSAPQISSDGRYIVFHSDATNLVANDAVPAVSDVYFYDRLVDQLALISVDSNGNAGNNYSSYASISDDGRYVAFESTASNLVLNDTNAHQDIFVHDRQTGQITLISTRINGTQTHEDSRQPMISGNGRYVVFMTYDVLSSDPQALPYQIYLRDLQTGTFELISRASDGAFADRPSDYPVITPDGRFVYYITSATNLGDNGPDPTNNLDNYVYDRQTQTNFNTNRDDLGNVSPIGSGLVRGAISDDGLITLWNTSSYIFPINYGWSFSVYNRSNSPTPTPTNTPTATNPVTATETPTSTATPSTTPSQTPSNTPTHTATITPSATNTATNTATWTDTSTTTPSVTASQTPSNTPTYTPTVTPSATNTPTSTATWTFTPTVTASSTSTPTFTVSFTPSVPPSATYTPTNTPTNTPSLTPTNTSSATWTPSPTPTKTPVPQNFDTLAIYDTQLQRLYLLNTLNSQPATDQMQTVQLANPNPIVGVMGDWNGDGLKTPGYYAGGIFYTTNLLNPTQASDWNGTWFGWTSRPVVAGRFAGSNHDCVGVVDSGYFPPYGTAFALYYTCDFSQINPPKAFQWLSVVLPDNQGFTGTHQFETGDFDGDGYDSVAVRRGAFIAYTNVAPGAGHAAFADAQYWGSPDSSGEGEFVSGDWDGNGLDSFGVYYPTSHLFYRRDDLDWNSGVYQTQSLPTLNATTVSVSSWRAH